MTILIIIRIIITNLMSILLSKYSLEEFTCEVEAFLLRNFKEWGTKLLDFTGFLKDWSEIGRLGEQAVRTG